MTATAQPRNTPTQAGNRRRYAVAAAVACNAGAIAALNASGFVVPASTATGLTAVGVFAHSANNSAGSAGDIEVDVERGIFRFENSADTDEITAADIGKKCYLVDDQTVAKTHATNTRSVAGFIDSVDDVGVWVRLDPTSGASA